MDTMDKHTFDFNKRVLAEAGYSVQVDGKQCHLSKRGRIIGSYRTSELYSYAGFAVQFVRDTAYIAGRTKAKSGNNRQQNKITQI